MKVGWQTIRFCDLGRVFNGNSISEADKKKHFAGQVDGLPYIATKDVGFDHCINYESGVRIPEAKQTDFKLAPANTVLVCAEGGSAGRKIAHSDAPIFFGNKLFAISPNHPHSSRFVFYFCLSDVFSKQFRAAMAGLIGGVSINKFKELTIQLPAASEQHRIVAILDEAFDGIATAKANADKNLQSARALFDRVLDTAILGGLQSEAQGGSPVKALLREIDRLRADAIEQGRAKRLKADEIEVPSVGRTAIPDRWQWVQLERLTTGVSDGVHKKPNYVDSGVPFVTVKNLTAGPGISFDDLNYVTRADHEEFIRRTHPERGDILITKDGTIGVVRLIDTDIEFSIFVSVALIKPVMRELGPYLTYALRAFCVQSQIVPQGAALKHLYLVDLRRLVVPLPPLAEQARIVSKLDDLAAEVERLESIYQQKLTALDDLKKSLLHQAFSGAL
ncbi:MAG: restriction endonuclease subunit S [Azonexus sp.]|nr:restriction endonuclease subunit S [Azonexus sp.]MBP8168177.1 restriction endonuclease subunit S [Azonexus sp.]